LQPPLTGAGRRAIGATFATSIGFDRGELDVKAVSQNLSSRTAAESSGALTYPKLPLAKGRRLAAGARGVLDSL
jgi:hypothetical protein